MLTDNDKTVVRDIVKEFVDKKWKFTAYTITTEARKKGITARHSELKQIVHDMYRDGEMLNYDRTTQDVGAPVKPFYYFPKDDSDDDVLQDDLDALDDKADQNIPAPVSAPVNG